MALHQSLVLIQDVYRNVYRLNGGGARQDANLVNGWSDLC